MNDISKLARTFKIESGTDHKVTCQKVVYYESALLFAKVEYCNTTCMVVPGGSAGRLLVKRGNGNVFYCSHITDNEGLKRARLDAVSVITYAVALPEVRAVGRLKRVYFFDYLWDPYPTVSVIEEQHWL